MREVRMSARQLAALTGEKQETPKATRKAATRPAQPRKGVGAHTSAPCVGKRYRVARGLDVHFTTPPPVNSVCHVWFVGKSAVWLDCFPPDSGAEIRLLVSEAVLRDYFEEEEGNG